MRLPLSPNLRNAAAARRAEAPNSVVAHTANPLVVSFNGYPLGTRFFCLENGWRVVIRFEGRAG